MAEKRRFIQIGIGGRGEAYLDAMLNDYQHLVDLVALCDSNEGRLRLAQETARAAGRDVPGYLSTDFARMMDECRPDCVLVTSPDHTHVDYACRVMELGCDVVTEKPMTIDEASCQRIVDAQRRTGRSCKVTFNLRFAPAYTQLKDLLMSGVIGDVISIDFHWLLDTTHGAEYFRRWHGQKRHSGGLMVHKATHHFDLINWFLSAVPVSVYAIGGRKFYTAQTAERLGLARRTERCCTCPHLGECRFGADHANTPTVKRLYVDNEQYDGYIRDRCIFSDNIDIEDVVHVIVTYDNGVTMSYSLNAFMPWEGNTIAFNGSKGRLEHKWQEVMNVVGDPAIPGMLAPEGTTTRIFPHTAPAYQVEIWQGEGSHGGGDKLLYDYLFNVETPADPYLRAADFRSGAYSILIGIAANRSMATGNTINIADLVHDLPYPDYTPMPTPDEPLVNV
jgi:predicted dehydrogenase